MASTGLSGGYEELRGAPDLPLNKDYHLFVCYTRENLNEVRIIVGNLEKEGYKCCYYERDFTAGQSVLENTDQAMNKSLHMLVILSEDLTTQPFAIHEIKEALHKRISDGYSIIPIRIEPCTVPECLKSITWIECADDDMHCMHKKIIDAVVRNDIASGLKYPNNGETQVFFLSSSGGFRSLSIPRFHLKIEPTSLLSNNIQLNMEDIEEIEAITFLARRCERNENLKDKLDPNLPIEEAIDVLFDNLLRSNIQTVERMVWPTRHYLKNGAQCLCMQIECG
ncbi:TLR1-like protein [Mya arenaria]|uniref:TLR1-like protein n=1 Tax=Mya arenaria TaxID=6604 RepID=A0ABY7FTQ3_MYAAR|nr:TLR1-like protein [Mya arenaria]